MAQKTALALFSFLLPSSLHGWTTELTRALYDEVHMWLGAASVTTLLYSTHSTYTHSSIHPPSSPPSAKFGETPYPDIDRYPRWAARSTVHMLKLKPAPHPAPPTPSPPPPSLHALLE
ncbi:hypothetical protein DFP73DRAFT_565733 [Morchella snyderi]|nr:hypothetical protein DFP73DRAFT_565733 [Morchella snyderi]